MQEKLAHVRRLLDQGYVLDDIDSDRGSIDATFRRGTQRAVVRFLPSEAERLLLTPGPLRLH